MNWVEFIKYKYINTIQSALRTTNQVNLQQIKGEWVINRHTNESKTKKWK